MTDPLQTYLTSNVASARKIYLRPPATTQMEYPCVIIERAQGDTKFADNVVHRHRKRYSLTAISNDGKSDVYDQLASLPTCVHDRSFTADNLNHDVFTIIF